jgi:hypothetical protein
MNERLDEFRWTDFLWVHMALPDEWLQNAAHGLRSKVARSKFNNTVNMTNKM